MSDDVKNFVSIPVAHPDLDNAFLREGEDGYKYRLSGTIFYRNDEFIFDESFDNTEYKFENAEFFFPKYDRYIDEENTERLNNLRYSLALVAEEILFNYINIFSSKVSSAVADR